MNSRAIRGYTVEGRGRSEGYGTNFKFNPRGYGGLPEDPSDPRLQASFPGLLSVVWLSGLLAAGRLASLASSQ
jgi:hypothetical protein